MRDQRVHFQVNRNNQREMVKSIAKPQQPRVVSLCRNWFRPMKFWQKTKNQATNTIQVAVAPRSRKEF